jgi:hypothetical protein
MNDSIPTSGDTDEAGRLTESRLPTVDQSNGLKAVAILFMTIDHVGAILLPNVEWLRFIGRIAFPLFAYQLAIGYIHTGNLRRYALRLVLWGLIAQPVYMAAFGVRPWELNIFAALLLGLLAMWGWDHRHWWAVALAVVSPLAQLWLPQIGPDYGVYGVALCLVSFLFVNDRSMLVRSHALLHILAAALFWPVQVWALASIPFILVPPRVHFRRLQRFFYVYYPAHLAVLTLIHTMLSR